MLLCFAGACSVVMQIMLMCVLKVCHARPVPVQVTEEQLAAYFQDCGRVMDCRICGDPNSAMRFAFIEFADVEFAAKVGRVGLVTGMGAAARARPAAHVRRRRRSSCFGG